MTAYATTTTAKAAVAEAIGDIVSTGGILKTAHAALENNLIDTIFATRGELQIVTGTNNATTDNAAFAAAITAIKATSSKTGTILVKGTCKLTGTHAMAANGDGAQISVRGIGIEESTLDLTAGSLQWVGDTLGSAASVTITGRNKVVYSSGPTWAAGDYVQIGSTDVIEDPSGAGTAAIVELVRISTHNAEEIEGALASAHATTATLKVRTLREGITVENIRIVADSTLSSIEGALHFLACNRPTIRNCDIAIAVTDSTSAITFRECYEPQIINNRIAFHEPATSTTAFRYGLIFGICNAPFISGNRISGQWDLIDTFGDANTVVGMKIVNNDFYGLSNGDQPPAAVTQHYNVLHTTIQNNNFHSCTIGIAGRYGLVQGNKCYGNFWNSATYGNASDGAILGTGADHRIIDNTVEDARIGFIQYSGVRSLIQGNSFSRCGTAILIYTNSGWDTSQDHHVLGNFIYGTTGTNAINVDDVAGMVIRGNHIPKASNTNSVRQQTGAPTIKIQRNEMDGYGSADNGIDSDDTHSTNYTDP